ncbi:hypothetical protein Bhyg_08467 [Pseudolycoriella hygida]|uniref:Tyr recombinase domain-containing protein n=1 Tax=Pseudolycoriella hygida TaxID=35572 RepID=A0A9Q0N4T0_9DIPT|nr:hypothetical protein Bhyg_08467 [Pseudolycoriella hygida]
MESVDEYEAYMETGGQEPNDQAVLYADDGTSKYRFENGFDEVDNAISQIDMNQIGGAYELVDDTDADNQHDFGFDATDEMEDIMTQIDINEIDGAHELVDDVQADDQHGFVFDGPDEMDDIMPQIDINKIGGAHEMQNDCDGNVAAGVEDRSISDIPTDMDVEYQQALDQIMPNKSASRYLQPYQVFRNWQKSRNTSSFDKKVLMVYFSEAATKYKPSTLWSMYSMLKKTLIYKHNVDISKISELVAFLKTKGDGYKCRKSNVFSPKEVQKFMVEAPNSNLYLAVAAMGVVGGLRSAEIINLTTDNVEDNGNEIVVVIPDSKTKDSKFFTVDGEMAKIIRQYSKLRPDNVPTRRFFLQYRNGKCTRQVMGKNTIAKVPKDVAEFLGLPNHLTFTRHGLRRTSTTILADTGVGIETLKRHGPWKGNSVCEGYIQNSLTHKRKIGRLITNAINLPSTSNADETDSSAPEIKKIAVNTGTFSQIRISSHSIADHFSTGTSNIVSSTSSTGVVLNGSASTSVTLRSPSISMLSDDTASAAAVIPDSPSAGVSLDNTYVSADVISTGRSAGVVSKGTSANVISDCFADAASSSAIDSVLPFLSKGKIVFHFSGQISNFNVIS